MIAGIIEAYLRKHYPHIDWDADAHLLREHIKQSIAALK